MSGAWSVIRHILRITVVVFVALLFLRGSVLELGDQEEQVRAFTRHIEFDYASWSLDAMMRKVRQIGLGTADYLPAEYQSQMVLDYLDLVDQILQYESLLDEYYSNPEITDPETASKPLRTELDQLYERRQHLAPLAEAIFQNQLTSVIDKLDLTLGGQSIPPALYHVTPLPLALIISPRDVIQRDAHISLQHEFTTDQRAALEEQIDQALNVSSLVVNVGGIGMYPTMVIQTTNINWLAEVVAHEWIHNYLNLRPLGVSYGESFELRIINETTASIAGNEVGAALIEQYYPEFAPPPPEPVTESSEDAGPQLSDPVEDESFDYAQDKPFDFRAAMHETRLKADGMLAEGKIEEAEAYMEARRQIFVENGYRIRKLNQAYFAFHGAYADLPGGAAGAAEDPVGKAVRTLRAQSSSLAEFVNRISWMWSFEQLLTVVN
ncbi:MAG: hypothetical protein ISR58_00550 [Anaerolineales bacterium]|nr:hypothetical protein [Chloroflexota bacterium]MBL6979653.1 hypothetical protein [Anaerolineales bacterium]